MSDAYTRFVSSVLFPAQERLKGHTTVRDLRALEASQWWPRERLEDFRVQRLRELLRHAGAHVPYYRSLFARLGFDPGAVRSLSALDALPVLCKADIRSQLAGLRSEQARDLVQFNTGGSSGEPLIFFVGKERVSRDVAAKWRATRWWDVDIGDPEIVVWGSPIELNSQDRLRGLRDRLLRTELLPAFEMSEGKLDGFLQRIRDRRPKMLFGYPSALAFIAAHAARRGVAMNDLGIVVAFVTSERLYDHQRETIERIFGCRVANGYGGRDAGFIAHECPGGNMHITAEDVIVEIVAADGKCLPAGATGQIVVTHLATKDFPFIRYATGDVGTMDDQPCACGRGLPVLSEIQGRATDFVVAQDGTVMHGLALVYILRALPGVRAYKIVQESRDRTRVLLVPEGPFPQQHLETIRDGFRMRLGAGVEIDTQVVSELEPERSGKFRYVVSHVAVN